MPDPGDHELMGGTELIAFSHIKSFIDKFNATDSALTNDAFPTLGYSAPSSSQGGFEYNVGWRDIINTINSTVEQRSPASEPEVVWSTDEVFNIAEGGTITVTAVGTDPFINAITPVKGAKVYTVASQTISPAVHDYLLVSGTVSVSLSRTSGQSTTITIVSTDVNTTAVITGLQLRATPVPVVRKTIVKDKDQTSIEINGPKTYTDANIDWAGVNDSKAIGEIILDQRFKRLPVIQFEVNNGSVKRIRQVLEFKLSDRIHLVNANTFTSHTFYVEQLEHHIEQAGNYHHVVVGCEQVPVALEGPFTFNVTGAGFNDGVFGDRTNKYNFAGNLFILGQSLLNTDKVLGL